MCMLGVKQYGSSPYCILPSSVLQYMTRLCYKPFHGNICTQLHIFYHFYVANQSRESETSAYSNLYAFVCHFVCQYIAIYCNMQYIVFPIGHIVLYCSSKYCNISIYQYIVSPLVYV